MKSASLTRMKSLVGSSRSEAEIPSGSSNAQLVRQCVCILKSQFDVKLQVGRFGDLAFLLPKKRKT